MGTALFKRVKNINWIFSISVVGRKLRNGLEDARRIYHGVAHERVEKSIAAVVVLFDLLGRRLNVLLG